MDVMISIKPLYARKICDGTKLFEYRKRIFKRQVNKVFIYASSPTKKIIGYFIYRGFISDTPEYVWELTKKCSGIEYEKYRKYFLNRDIAYAIKIQDFIAFNEPVDPKDIFDNFMPPQSYMYIKEGNSYEKFCNMVHS